jgi:hypothetical protein
VNRMPQRLSNREQGDRGKESSCSPRGRARARLPEPSGDGGRRWREFAGGGEENRQRTESAGGEEETEPGHGLGQRGIF